jgi:hypothetical protein
MGNLTDIGLGVGKYLTAADASSLPQIDDNAVDLANLHFKLATNNNFVKYNMVDGFFDAFQDTSGVDAGNSTNEIRDGTGEYYSGTGNSNLTLISATQTAVAAPTTGRLCIFEHTSTGSATINTDIKGWVSRDNGSNYDQITLVSQSEYESGKRMLSGSVDFTMASGTNMRYKITTHNQSSTKITRVHGASMLWS